MIKTCVLCLEFDVSAHLPYQNIRVVKSVGPSESHRRTWTRGYPPAVTPHGIWRIICPCAPGSPTSLLPIISQDSLDGANRSTDCTGEFSGQGRTAGQVLLYLVLSESVIFTGIGSNG